MKSTDWIKNHTKIVLKDGKTGEEIILLDTTGEQAKTMDGDIVAGIPFVDVLDDSLDSFVFTLKNCPRRKPFSPFSLVTYTVTNEIDGEIIEDKTKLFVQFDKVQSYSRINKDKLTYEHTVSCVETAKILEKTKIFNMNLTNRNDTLLRQFEKACVNAEPVLVDYYFTGARGQPQRFFLSDKLKEFLKEKSSYDFYFSNTDFRTVLDTMLATQNARVTVEDIGYGSNGVIQKISLGYIPLTTVKDVEPEWKFEENGEIVGEELSNDGQDYAGKIVARGYNSISDEPLEFTDTFKVAYANVSDKTAAVFLPFPISDRGIKSFVIHALVQYRYYPDNILAAQKKRYYVMPVEISNHLIPQEQYDLLDEEDAREYIPYQIGQSAISFGGVYSKFLGAEVLKVQEIVKEYLNASIPGSFMIDDIILGSVLYSGKKNSVEEMEDYYNNRFTCFYYPQIDTVADIPKPNVYDKNTLRMGVMDSQTEQTLSIDRHGKKLSGLIQRTGNTEYCLDVKAKYFCNLLPLMSRINLPNATDEDEQDYVLYKREYSMYDGFVNCRYYFSQHYNSVQANAGVNRGRHLFDIPLEADETPLVVKKALYFTFDEATPSSIEASFNQSFLNSAIKTLFGKNAEIEYETEYKTESGVLLSKKRKATGQLKYLLFQTIGEVGVYPQKTENASDETPYTDSDYRFALPLCNYAQGKTMNFAARTLDNYSVGYARDGYVFSIWGDGGNKITYNRYVDKESVTIGECKQFILEYAFEFKNVNIPAEAHDSKEDCFNLKGCEVFPVANKNDFVTVLTNDYPTLRYNYFKDRTQRPLFILSVDCVVDKEYKDELFVGAEFAKYNNLVTSNTKEKKLCISYDFTLSGEETQISTEYLTKSTQVDPAHAFEFSVDLIQPTTKSRAIQINPDEEFESGGDLIQSITIPRACLKYKNEIDETVKSWAIVDENRNIYLAGNGNLRDIYVFMADLLQ